MVADFHGNGKQGSTIAGSRQLLAVAGNCHSRLSCLQRELGVCGIQSTPKVPVGQRGSNFRLSGAHFVCQKPKTLGISPVNSALRQNRGRKSQKCPFPLPSAALKNRGWKLLASASNILAGNCPSDFRCKHIRLWDLSVCVMFASV